MSLKTTARLLFTALMLVLAPIPATSAEQIFEGSWSMTTRMGGREIPATMTLSRDADGALRGRWISQDREMTLTEIAIDGDAIRFDREIPGGTLLHYEGTLGEDSIEGAWNGPFGEATCNGNRSDEPAPEIDPDAIPNQHDRAMVEEDGRLLLWANEDDEGAVEWFDMTGSTIDPADLQYGVGKDTIAPIDRPEFIPAADPRLAARGVTGETEVLGVSIEGVARAYPVALMDLHEVVNDRFGEQAYAVLW